MRFSAEQRRAANRKQRKSAAKFHRAKIKKRFAAVTRNQTGRVFDVANSFNRAAYSDSKCRTQFIARHRRVNGNHLIRRRIIANYLCVYVSGFNADLRYTKRKSESEFVQSIQNAKRIAAAKRNVHARKRLRKFANTKLARHERTCNTDQRHGKHNEIFRNGR